MALNLQSQWARDPNKALETSMKEETTPEKELAAIAEKARLLESQDRDGTLMVSPTHRPILLYGAGPLGGMTLCHMRSVGLSPVALVDSNEARWGTYLDGVPIIPPAEAIRQYRKTGRFIVTIYNGSFVRNELRAAGCDCVSHFADFYFEYSDECLPFCGLANRSVVLDAWADVVAAANVWHDERSKMEYLAQLSWRLRISNHELSAHDPPEHCYFPPGIFEFEVDETLLDCGAFDGDSLRHYLSRMLPGTRPKIVAFEPDSRSFSRLATYAETMRQNGVADIRVEPLAVAGHSGTIGFAALGSVRSGVAAENIETVPCVAIDDLALAPTLVKMDVEGSELQALRGASVTLKRHLPVLAISLYHHATDLWTIPLFIKSLVPDYRLFLRRYAEDCWEQILYAVPESRLSVPTRTQ